MPTLSGALASGAGQVTVNLLTPCTPWHSGLGWAMVTGGVTGGISLPNGILRSGRVDVTDTLGQVTRYEYVWSVMGDWA